MNAPSKRLLPASWVDRIFDRMQGFYGSLWVDRWRSGELDENGRDRGLMNAKATWCAELGGFAEQPERIHRALEACRHRGMPPTLPEFLELCRQAPADAVPALTEPTVAPEVAKQRAEALQEKASQIGQGSKSDHRGWARRIMASPKSYPSVSVVLAREAIAAPIER